MPTGQGPPARLTVGGQAPGGQPGHVDRGLPVPELTDVEVVHLPVQGVQAVVAEQVVTRRLHEALALHHPAPLRLVARASRIRLEHGAGGLLQLEQQRVGGVPAGHQDDPVPGPHAAHPDDFAGQAGETVGLDQGPQVRLKAPAVLLQERADHRDIPLPLLLVEQLLDRDHQGRRADEPQFAAALTAKPAERTQVVVSQRLAHRLLDRALAPVAFHRGHPLLQLDGREPGVPHLEVASSGEVEHRLPVGPYRREHRDLPFTLSELQIPARDLDARRTTLDVPLDRAGPGRVSSKSLSPNTRARSGVSNMPKLSR